MSKSLNNFFTVRDIREQYSGDVIRFFLLSGHYRSPIDFSIDKYLYKPTGNPKPIKMCIDTTNYDAVMARIEKAQGLTDAEREVLKLCAYRFIEINMADMAEYYCHASDAMREAMEDNCLVIVDGKRLIEKGLIKLSEDIQEVLQLEMDEDA